MQKYFILIYKKWQLLHVAVLQVHAICAHQIQKQR